MPVISEAPINRYPQGLLGLLDVKSMGKVPNSLQDRVQAVVSLDHYYRAQNRTTKISTIVVDGLGIKANTAFTPPAGKIWLVESMRAVSGGLAATQVLRLAPAIFMPSAAPTTLSEVIWAGENGITLITSTSGICGSWTFDPVFVMLPGYYGGVYVSQADNINGGAPVNVPVALTVTEVEG